MKPEHQPKLRFIYGFGRGLFILSERDNKLFFILGIDVDVDFVFAGEPAESSVKLFIFELGYFFKLFYTHCFSGVKSIPNCAGIKTNSFCVHLFDNLKC